jgi:hypothetical protein
MKKLLVFLTVVSLSVFGLTACGNKSGDASSSATTAASN